ncbi:HAMP domain-containing sensor histidine kinase [Clostridium brassicae]|uniref:histidine kinase n=1 Tax=Clostridium brassicae TaxID=2999072 RepID=A0ABT4D754_9CLOT|nr:HAMP domain-containing sensor histidine kinase [Clostridium brassicae]MCY6958100.1 HAMP domain-containing sensor histidine kinase [Clostridium brassicae]
MKKTFRSISWKIWYDITRIIAILLIIIFIANITVFKNAKDEFIFNQLKESAEAKKNGEQSFIQPNKLEGTSEAPILVAHFRIEKNGDKINITIDKFTEALYLNNKNNEQIIDKIVDNISKYGVEEDQGIIKDNGMSHYYYVDWNDTKTSAMVFLTSSKENIKFGIEVFAIIIILLIISFFTSKIAAKKIAEPIQKLVIFAEEISKRNWSTKVPKTDPDEIGLLSEALEKMRDSLKIAEERDRQFLQSTSHDLKTPVMIIKGYAQAILDDISINSERSAAEVIKTESERLERRITQLLKLNTLGHILEYSENREIVRIDRILKSIISKFSIVSPELNWELNFKELEIKGDAEALLIAFENIIENQLRYAKTSISISIDINDKSEIKISNDGPPFEVNDPNILFDTYKKDKEGKFGLGLAIVKQVIEAHGGTILAYNINKGVEFKINF